MKEYFEKKFGQGTAFLISGSLTVVLISVAIVLS